MESEKGQRDKQKNSDLRPDDYVTVGSHVVKRQERRQTIFFCEIVKGLIYDCAE